MLRPFVLFLDPLPPLSSSLSRRFSRFFSSSSLFRSRSSSISSFLPLRCRRHFSSDEHRSITPPSSPLLFSSSPRRVLIYQKISLLEELRRGVLSGNLSDYLLRDSKAALADREHSQTISSVLSSVHSHHIQTRLVEKLHSADLSWCDLLICIGGDGTFLRACRKIEENSSLPILSVNSSPSSSFGFFSAADRQSFPRLFDKIMNKTAIVRPLWRIRPFVNGEPMPRLAVNEALFSSPLPAVTTRYIMENRGISQAQQSSGVWISTAAGSTGAIFAAGGAVQNLSDKRVQFRVRELYTLSALKKINRSKIPYNLFPTPQPLKYTSSDTKSYSNRKKDINRNSQNNPNDNPSNNNVKGRNLHTNNHRSAPDQSSYSNNDPPSPYHHTAVKNDPHDVSSDPLPSAAYYNHYYAHQMSLTQHNQYESDGGDLDALTNRSPQYNKPDIFGDAMGVNDIVRNANFKAMHHDPATNAVMANLLTSGFACNDFQLTCRMAIGCIWTDGCTTPIEVGFGDRITFRVTKQPLHWISPTRPTPNDNQVTDGWERVTNRPRPPPPKLMEGACDTCGELHSSSL